MNRFDFEGRIALVTGGASGIGAATVRRLLDSGARVAVFDRDKARVPPEVHAIEGDVTLSTAIDEGVAATEAEFGGLDILVCCAGISGESLSTVDVSDQEWNRVFAVNANGVFYANRAVLPGMLRRGYGRIVNIASIAGKEGNPNAAHYSASKAGLIALTKSLGKELAAYDIAVNCVTPAAAKTAIFDQMTQQHIDFMLSKIPRGRFVKVEELASMVTWMASEECAFTTGAVFDISGGRATY